MRTKRVQTRSSGITETVSDTPVRCANPDCGAEFVPLRPWHVYHTTRCRVRHWRQQSKSLPKPAGLSATARLPRVLPGRTRGRAKAEVQRAKVGFTIYCIVELS